MRFYKKVILFIILLLFVRSVIHDLSVGTFSEQVPSNKATEESSGEKSVVESPPIDSTKANAPNTMPVDPYQKISYTVQAGDTVLSITEQINEGHVPIQQLLLDFEKLNPGANPHEIHIGETYFFPIYNKE